MFVFVCFCSMSSDAVCGLLCDDVYCFMCTGCVCVLAECVLCGAFVIYCVMLYGLCFCFLCVFVCL